MRLRVALVLLLACDKPRPIDPAPAPAPWPSIPADVAQADALIAAHTKRPIAPRTELALDAWLAKDGAIGGWPAIQAWLRARGDAWVLVGTHHDSAAPLDAFRRLLDPDGVAWTRVVMEQLRADGEWQGMPLGEQLGDSEDVKLYVRGRSEPAFRRLLAAQEENDYAAWKFGYARSVLDVVTAGRYLGVSTCDAPRAVADRFPEPSRLRLRELHCKLALDHELRPGPRRIAMLWGEGHIGRDGFARYLEPSARVVTIRIPRESPAPVMDPVLLVDGDDAVLLVPDSPAHFDRVRQHHDQPVPHRFIASSRSPAELRVAGRIVPLTATTREEDLAPGVYPFVVYVATRPRAIGVLEMPKDGALTLRVEDTEPMVSVVTRTRD
jgi:hypothetical protein